MAAALLGLAGGAGPAGAGAQRHHLGRPPAELPDGAAAHRLLPQRHRAGTARRGCSRARGPRLGSARLVPPGGARSRGAVPAAGAVPWPFGLHRSDTRGPSLGREG